MKIYTLMYLILISSLIHPMNHEYPLCYCAQDLEQYDPCVLAEVFSRPPSQFMLSSVQRTPYQYTIACPHCAYYRKRNSFDLKKMIASFRKHVQMHHPTSHYRLKAYTESIIKEIEIIAHS